MFSEDVCCAFNIREDTQISFNVKYTQFNLGLVYSLFEAKKNSTQILKKLIEDA